MRLRLPYDHTGIIALAVEHLRQEYRTEPDPRHLLPDAFTIADLRAVHEGVAGRALQKDTFRRLMIDSLKELPGRGDRAPGSSCAALLTCSSSVGNVVLVNALHVPSRPFGVRAGVNAR